LGAFSYNDTPVVDKPWDGPGAEAKLKTPLSKSTAAQVYAWFANGGDPTLKATYKLPHHEVASDGTPGAANVNGVRAALGRLSQTKGVGSDAAAVRAHLQKHLDKFNAGKKSTDDELETHVEAYMPFDLIALEAEGRTWAVREQVMEAMQELMGSLVGPVPALKPQIRVARRSAGGKVAMIPLKGMITPQPSLLAMLMGGGGGGLVGFRQDLREAVADPDVSHIVLDVDSPGGLVDMVPEVANDVYQAREAKPIVAVANTLAASAAYWLASQAHEVVVSPSAEVGSIGVYQLHRDISGALERSGVKPTLISAGKYKVEGNPFEPLGDEARQAAQTAVNDYYEMFTADVARGRGVDAQDVAEGYGEGRSLTAKRAVKAGLADRVATLSETVSRLASGRARVRQGDTGAGDFSEGELASTEGYSAEEKDRLLTVLAGRR
jgi:signal peptide peptidase SppA